MLTAFAALILAPTLKDLKDLPTEFNSAVNEVRLVVVVSPTSPRGTRTVRKIQESVLDPLVGLPIRTFVVWTAVLPEDDLKAAQQSTRFANSVFVSHYWDPIRTLPKELGPQIKLPAGRELAWDCVFIFKKGVKWVSSAPKPAAWMHQFGKDENQFDLQRLRELVQKEAGAGLF